MSNKIEEISNKLEQLDYAKIVLNKPTIEEFNKSNVEDEEFMDKLTELLGDRDKAEKYSAEYNSHMFNLIPNMRFYKQDELEIEIFEDRSEVIISSRQPLVDKDGELGCISACQLLPFKTLSVDEFHTFIVVNGFDIKLMVSDN